METSFFARLAFVLIVNFVALEATPLEEKLAAEFEADLNAKENPLFQELELDIATDLVILANEAPATEVVSVDSRENVQKPHTSIAAVISEKTTSLPATSSMSSEERPKLETLLPLTQAEDPTVTSFVLSTTTSRPSTTSIKLDQTTTSPVVTTGFVSVAPKKNPLLLPAHASNSLTSPPLKKTNSKILLIDSKIKGEDYTESEEEVAGNGRPPTFRNSALNSFLLKKKKERKESTTEYDPLANFFRRYIVTKPAATEKVEEVLVISESEEPSSARTIEEATPRQIPGLKRFGFPGKKPDLFQLRKFNTATVPTMRVIEEPTTTATSISTKRSFGKPNKFFKKFEKTTTAPSVVEEKEAVTPPSQVLSRRTLFRPRTLPKGLKFRTADYEV